MLQGVPSIMTARGIGNTLLNGLTVYYALSDTSDATGGGLTLTNHGSVTFSAGKVGNAANFVAASNQYLTRADSSAFQMGTGDFTIAAWVKFSAGDAGTPFFFAYGKDVSTGYGIRVSGAAGGVQVFISDGSNNKFAGDTHVFSDGNWHLIIGTMLRSGNMTCIVDNATEGLPVSITTITGSVNNANGLSIGGAYDGTRLTTSSVDEAGIWNRVLTSTETTALWNGGTGTTYPF